MSDRQVGALFCGNGVIIKKILSQGLRIQKQCWEVVNLATNLKLGLKGKGLVVEETRQALMSQHKQEVMGASFPPGM